MHSLVRGFRGIASTWPAAATWRVLAVGLDPDRLRVDVRPARSHSQVVGCTLANVIAHARRVNVPWQPGVADVRPGGRTSIMGTDAAMSSRRLDPSGHAKFGLVGAVFAGTALDYPR